MNKLNIEQMEQINGGEITGSEIVGIACGITILAGIFGGPIGLATFLALGPTACIANPAIIAAS